MAAEKYAPVSVPKRKSNFQKKFVLVDYMGEDAPCKFALKESYVVMRGILPEINVCAEEQTVRSIVAESIRHSDQSLSSLASTQFQFLEACGKCLCVPAYGPGFSWTGRAVKELAGTGAIYLRLTIQRDESDNSTTSSDVDTLLETDVKFVKIENPGKWTYVTKFRKTWQSVGKN